MTTDHLNKYWPHQQLTLTPWRITNGHKAHPSCWNSLWTGDDLSLRHLSYLANKFTTYSHQKSAVTRLKEWMLSHTKRCGLGGFWFCFLRTFCRSAKRICFAVRSLLGASEGEVIQQVVKVKDLDKHHTHPPVLTLKTSQQQLIQTLQIIRWCAPVIMSCPLLFYWDNIDAVHHWCF